MTTKLPTTVNAAKGFALERTKIVAGAELCRHPRVSVCMQAFNHGDYIEKAVTSVLEQEVDFEFEILIGDDQSKDRTLEIVQQLQQRHPDKIILFESLENLGQHTGNGRYNFLRNLSQARGDYIAFLEGDDFWTDRRKLADQVSWLDAHADYGASVHDTEIQNDITGEKKIWRQYGERLDFDLAFTISISSPFHTSSFFCRTSILEDLPDYFLTVQSADMAFFMFAAAVGNIRRIPRVMSVYRRNEGGVTAKSEYTGFNYQLARHRLHTEFQEYLNPVEQHRFKSVKNHHARAAFLLSLKGNPATVVKKMQRVFKEVGFAATVSSLFSKRPATP